MATSVNMEANSKPLSQSYDFRGQETHMDGEEARITYSVVGNDGGGEKFKCDGCDKICERSISLRPT
jgi:hypothetical protein